MRVAWSTARESEIRGMDATRLMMVRCGGAVVDVDWDGGDMVSVAMDSVER